jgi:hypothetical protein
MSVIYLAAAVNYATCSPEFGTSIGTLVSRFFIAALFVVGEITLLTFLYYSHVLQKNGLESGY